MQPVRTASAVGFVAASCALTFWALAAVGCARSLRGEPGGWVDPAPHTVSSIRGEAGVKLELLDFHGSGPPVLLLAGLGDSAHVWDDWAGALTSRFHVWALTRRGFGASERPDAGYTVPALAGDVLAALDVIAPTARAGLVGHSIAGEELSFLARAHSERVAAVVYLDAAYDRTTVASAFADVDVPKEAQPAPTEQDLHSIAAYRRYTWGLLRLAEPEAEVRSQWTVTSDGRLLPGPANPAFGAIFQAVEPPRYAQGKVPVLSFYAKATAPQDELPLYPSLSVAAQKKVDLVFAANAGWTAQERARLKAERPDAEVVEVVGGAHYLHLHDEHRAAVHRRIADFLGQHLGGAGAAPDGGAGR